MAIRLSSALAEQMFAHARHTADEEVCGLLFGSIDQIVAVQPTRNVAADRVVRFEVDPGALIAALKAARSGGPPLVGCYHSHPNGVSEPSETDRAMARAGEVWVIVAGRRISAWQMADPIPVALDVALIG